MRVLAWETADLNGSIAALDDEQILAESMLAADQRTARWLAPALGDVLKLAGWKPVDVELIAVATGPGSFTGLRIGVTTAKAFAYAVGCPVVGVNTLLAIASRAPVDVADIWAVVDAQRRQLFAGRFVRADSKLAWQTPTHLVDEDAWLAGLTASAIVTGPGLRKLVARLPAGVVTLDEQYWAPTGGAVGRLGHKAYLAGQRDDPFALVPQYFRRPAAEEQWERREI